MPLNLGTSAVSLYLGSQSVNAYLGGTLVTPPAGDPFATLVSTKSTGDVSGVAFSTTGYIKVEWWDETSDVYGTGSDTTGITWSKAAGGAGEKTIKIYPSDVNGDLDGGLTFLDCQNNSLTSLDVSGLTTTLNGLYCNNNVLTSLRAAGFSPSAFYTTPFTPSTPGYESTGLSDNMLNAAALNQFFQDLADLTLSGGNYAILFVGNNPGLDEEAYNPGIATAKNYIVVPI